LNILTKVVTHLFLREKLWHFCRILTKRDFKKTYRKIFIRPLKILLYSACQKRLAFPLFVWLKHSTSKLPESGNILYESKENVCVQRSFVSLVHDHDAVGGQIRFAQELSEKHSICHILKNCAFRCAVFKSKERI